MDDMAQAAVVLHFRDGRTVHEAATPEIDDSLQLVKAVDGDIPFGALKAIFFRREKAEEMGAVRPQGSLVAVEFADGEVLRGLAHDYNPLAPGFYLTPLDELKLQRVFVVSSAVVSIEVEKL